jgi:hypothetical protein
VREIDNAGKNFLADSLAVAQPLTKKADLAGVISVVKSIERNGAAHLLIE